MGGGSGMRLSGFFADATPVEVGGEVAAVCASARLQTRQKVQVVALPRQRVRGLDQAARVQLGLSFRRGFSTRVDAKDLKRESLNSGRGVARDNVFRTDVRTSTESSASWSR